MGGDGGSFTHRTETVRTKAKTAVVDRRNQLLAAWFTCTLSKRELQPPLVADALGKMYNKDALLEFLLAPPPSADAPISSRPFGQDGLLAAGHLRSLKDVQDLKLTPATSTGEQSTGAAGSAGGQIEYGKAQFECPITMRGMNGSVKFVYVKGCGCVASEVGLREVAGINSDSGKENDGAEKEETRAVCPVCGSTLPGSKVELVTLNPVGEEKEKMAKAWAEKVAVEEKIKAYKKAAKKKKRKEPTDETDAAHGTKKTKTADISKDQAPSINRKLPAMPEGKKPVSAAIASLYARDEGKAKLSPLFSSGYSRM